MVRDTQREHCYLMRETLSSTGWNTVGIGVDVESIVAVDSNRAAILGVDESFWVSNAGHWNPLNSLSGGEPMLSAGQNGTIYATCNEHSQYVLHEYDPDVKEFKKIGAVSTKIHRTAPRDLWTMDPDSKCSYNVSDPIGLIHGWVSPDQAQSANQDQVGRSRAES